MAKTPTKIIPPYVPWETFTQFLAHLKATAVPPCIDKSAMPSNMPTLVRGQVQSTLRFLGLIDSSATTDETLHGLVQAYETQDWRERLEGMIFRYYDGIINDLDLDNATQNQLDERFGTAGVTGQMRLKSIRFFLSALTAAGKTFSPHFSARRKSTPKRSVRKPAIAQRGKTKEKEKEPISGNPTNVSQGMTLIPIGGGRHIAVEPDITDDDVDVIETMIPALRAMAKRHKKGGP